MEDNNTPLAPHFAKETAIVPAALARCSTKVARDCLGYETALQLSALPLGLIKQRGREILTLTTDRTDIHELQIAVRFASGKEVSVVSTKCADIKQAIFVAYQGDVEQLSKQALKLRTISPAHMPVASPIFREVKGEEGKFLISLIDYAIARKASDIHLIPKKEGSVIKLRISGKLYSHEATIGDQKIHQTLINRIKILAGLDISQHQKPLDGTFEIPLLNFSTSLRVSIMPTVHGEKAVLRLLCFQEIPALDDLGFEKNILLGLKNDLKLQSGLILFCGPTGSGKSTSLYSSIQTVVESGRNVVTLEDPVECIIEGTSQTSLNYKSGLDYCSGLKAILRQDPEVILLGEIRDTDSAQSAIQAALTGHLILSTVHGGNPQEALKRLMKFGVSELDLNIVKLVIAQRLLRRICQKCKVLDLFASNAAGCTIVKAVGCPSCDHSGFDGSVLASAALIRHKEEIPINKSLKDLLEKGFISMQQYVEYRDDEDLP